MNWFGVDFAPFCSFSGCGRNSSSTRAQFPTHSKFTEFYNTDGDAYKNDFADGREVAPSGVQADGGRRWRTFAGLKRILVFALPLLLSAIPGRLALLAREPTQQSYS
jgi:hypothetical protein